MGLGRDRGGVILRYGGEQCDVILIRMDQCVGVAGPVRPCCFSSQGKKVTGRGK